VRSPERLAGARLSYLGQRMSRLLDRLRTDWWTIGRAGDARSGLGHREVEAGDAVITEFPPACESDNPHRSGRKHRAVAASGQAMAARPVLPVAIGLASIGLLGWLIASRRNTGRIHSAGPE
jgi:hypothetical protein